MAIDNKDLVRRWFEEVWNKGRVGAIDEMLTEDCVVHGFGDDLRGPEGFKPFHEAYRDAFPDVNITVDEVISEGDIVAARWSGRGTHRGHRLGFAATHKAATLSGMVFVRVRDGRIAEGWNTFDQFGMLQQLGAVSMPGN
jgi:steroid delta-isomerase-like uncharacterized protein